MLVVAFDLSGTVHMAFDQDRAGVSAQSESRGVEHRPAGNHLFRLAHIRNDRLQRLLGAGGHAGQRQRSAHQLQEAAPRNRIQPLRRALGKLAVHHLLKLGAAGEFFQAAPVFRAFGLGDARAGGLQVELALLAGTNFLAVRFVSLFHFFSTSYNPVILSGARVREAKSRGVEGPLWPVERQYASGNSPWVLAVTVRMPSIIKKKPPTLAGSFDCIAASLCKAAIPLRMTIRSKFPNYRWHVEQLVISVTVRNLYFFTKSVPSETWSVYSLPSTTTGFALGRLLVAHIEHLIARPQILLRRAMAFQAPLHLQRSIVVHQRHAVDRPVAGVAAHALVDVNAVIEINEIRQIVDPGPHQRLAAAETLAHRLQQRRSRPDLRVAVHAGFGRRNAGKAGSLDRSVAIAAIDAQARHVVLVAEGHRLRRAGLRHKSCKANAAISSSRPEQRRHQEYRAINRGPGNCVRTAMKNLHRLTLSVQ